MSDPIIIRPATLHGQPGWHVWEQEGVCAFYPVKEQAVGYAITRAANGRRALEYHDATGKVLRRLEGPEAAALAAKRNEEETEPDFAARYRKE